jgi:filamentous hemagglutinin
VAAGAVLGAATGGYGLAAAAADAASGAACIGTLSKLGKLGKFAAKSADEGSTVIGHFPEYLDRARELGARAYQARGDWKWHNNRQFLYRAAKRGDEIVLDRHISQVGRDRVLEREIRYLTKWRGYQISDDGMRLVPPSLK